MTSTTKLPVWFWVIAVVGLLWNLMGVSAYIADAYQLIELSPEQEAFNTNKPVWYTAAYAFGVFAGALGCVALLLRKKWAVQLFLISLIGVLITHTYSFFFQDDIVITGGLMIVPIIVVIIAGLLYWYSKGAREKSWLS